MLTDSRLLAGALAALLFCVSLCARAQQEEQPAAEQQRLAQWLAGSSAAASLPGLAGVTPGQLAAKPQAAAVLEWAREVKDAPVPVTTYTQYRRFREAGERPPYEGPYFDKREQLSQAVLAVWLGDDESYLPQVNDLIWNICEESTWVVPAHEKEPWFIDLFCSETAAILAHVSRLLADRLPPEIQDRIHAEVARRVLEPYLEHGAEYGWRSGNNNWTGVCAGSVGQAFLLLEPDPERSARAIALVVEQLQRFLANAFEKDGASLEGMGYWNYGLAEYVIFAEMLRERTGGGIDLLADEKLRAVARFPLTVAIGPGLFASFSDSGEGGHVRAYIGAKLAERTGVTELLGLLEPRPDFRVHETVCDLLWWDGTRPAAPPLEDIVLPESGLARLVDIAGGHTLAVAVKAGDNAEPHNQNDVGSFIVAVDGVVYLCDPGAGLYSKDYFSPRRYENVFCNSYGHSVPRIGGVLQAEGREARGVMEEAGEKGVRVRFEQAYPGVGLASAARDIVLSQGAVVLGDHYVFEAEPGEVEEAFVTWCDVETAGPVARIRTDRGTLEIHAQHGEFRTERLEEACRQNRKSGVLSRVTVTYPADKEVIARFRMTFHPKT